MDSQELMDQLVKLDYLVNVDPLVKRETRVPQVAQAVWEQLVYRVRRTDSATQIFFMTIRRI